MASAIMIILSLQLCLRHPVFFSDDVIINAIAVTCKSTADSALTHYQSYSAKADQMCCLKAKNWGRFLCATQGYRSGSPTAVQAWQPCPLWEPSPSHPILV